MNKQEALAYIESGAEATKANAAVDARTGWPVRLLGYGYRTPSPTSQLGWKREDWDTLQHDSGKGVLVENLRYRSLEVVQLRQLHATTVEQAKADHIEWRKKWKREKAERAAKYESDKLAAARLTELLGGEVNDRYGTTLIMLTIEQAEALALRLGAMAGAS